MKLSLELAKTSFFDRAVVNAVKDAGRKILGRFGAFVRRDGRKSIKTAKRKTPGELTPEERQRLAMRFRLWAVGRIAKKPLPPFRSSAPGNPPLAHGSKSPIKLILFAYDAAEQSVVVGPVAFGRQPGVATAALEYGGATQSHGHRFSIAARPNIVPAFDKNLPHLRNWRSAL
jgi:hypothetical protein